MGQSSPAILATEMSNNPWRQPPFVVTWGSELGSWVLVGFFNVVFTLASGFISLGCSVVDECESVSLATDRPLSLFLSFARPPLLYLSTSPRSPFH